MNKITYETKPYCEFLMNDAVREYDEKLSVSALEIATKYGVPVQDLHRAYAQYKAKK
jgi:hypothetical protein